MAYALMSASELKGELLRRTSKMEEWTNDVNLDKAQADLVKELDEGKEANKIASAKIEKAKKQMRLYTAISIASEAIAFVLGAFLIFLAISKFTVPILFGFLGIFIILLIPASFADSKIEKIKKADYLKDANESHEKSEALYWYYILMHETDVKLLYKRVYEDTYKVYAELNKDPKIKKKIEAIKKDLGIDFSYVDEKLKKAEERMNKSKEKMSEELEENVCK